MEPVLTDAGAAVDHLADVPAGRRRAAAREFYGPFLARHRTVISMVFFDRAALEPDVTGQVDRLVDGVARALAASDGTAAVARAEAEVYGLAALVTRRPGLDDDALGALLRDALVPA